MPKATEVEWTRVRHGTVWGTDALLLDPAFFPSSRAWRADLGCCRRELIAFRDSPAG